MAFRSLTARIAFWTLLASALVYLAALALIYFGVHAMLLGGAGAILTHGELARRAELLLGGVGALSLLGLLALGALAVRTGRRITRPLRALNADLERVARGDLDSPLTPIDRQDELGQLARAVDAMRSALKAHIGELTAAVQARSRMDGELQAAREIQRSMLPGGGALQRSGSGFALCARLMPARSVGGDFYGVFRHDTRHLCFALGDVSDKGVPAALFMARVVGHLESAARDTLDPQRILTRLNAELCQRNDNLMFVTLFCGVLDLAEGALAYASAGHEAPLLLRADGECVTLPIAGGPPLGVDPAAQFAAQRYALDAGDLLLAYTDGVTDARAGGGGLFGEARLTAALLAGERAPAAAVERVLASLQRHTQDSEPGDDITLFALQYLAMPAEGRHAGMRTRFVMPARLDMLEQLLARVQGTLERAGAISELVVDARLVLEELLTNTLRYGYADGGAQHHIAVAVTLTLDQLELTVDDDAPPFDPFTHPLADPAAWADGDARVGGLGLYLVRRLASVAEYSRADDRNRTRIVLPRWRTKTTDR
ncbi:MAG: SpoIIE family protein phosphatase [Mizugakiibacter sp.]|uniref:ATP-binding SpoIIE family protein phosphatase n=1 Tax=Mizugakiibacter sp. TaxID=1972610 RepID=UPI0031CA03BF|nr:SpoIIE family protein phosphatase [Xanthomonadaceae bacterium]